MRISGPHGSPLPAPNPAGRSRGGADTAPVDNQPAPAAPVTTPEVPATETPAEGKAHGLARAAEHSHRSDVAALRQWINHPDLRSSLTVPDLTGEHKGRGFERAVAAYQKAIATTAPTPPAPVTDPTPVTDPAPVTDPPAATDPAPVTDAAAAGSPDASAAGNV